MPNTGTTRTQQELLDLFADNSPAEGISEQDGRDFIVSAIPSWWTYDHTPGSESVTFNGVVNAAGNYASLGEYDGNPITVADGDFGQLTWDNLGFGATLLDLTNPANPTVIDAGIYSITAVVNARSVFSAGGIAQAVLHLDANATDTICQMTFNAGNASFFPTVSINNTAYIPAGGVIQVKVYNYDGVSSRDFKLLEASVQRIV